MAMSGPLNVAIGALKEKGVLRWRLPTGIEEEIVLSDARARQLVQTLVDGAYARLDAETGTVGEKAATEEAFFARLDREWTGLSADTEGNAPEIQAQSEAVSNGYWLLQEVRTQGFGGLNGFDAASPMVVGIDDGSACFFGGNGSGKSSLI